jgi:hypothetical protein
MLARHLTTYAHCFIVRTMTTEPNQPTNQADIVRDRLFSGAHSVHTQPAALAALDALVAERDEVKQALYDRDDYSRKTKCDCHENSVGDPDYSHAYQDEYQALWHAASARAKAAEAERDEALRRVAAYEQYDVWQGLAAENRRLEAEVARLRETLRLARQDIITVNTAAWDSSRGEAALAAITAIDAALAPSATGGDNG